MKLSELQGLTARDRSQDDQAALAEIYSSINPLAVPGIQPPASNNPVQEPSESPGFFGTIGNFLKALARPADTSSVQPKGPSVQDLSAGLELGGLSVNPALSSLAPEDMDLARAVSRFSPYKNPFDETSIRDNTKGAGNRWEEIMTMTPEGIKELLDSDWKTDSEFSRDMRKRKADYELRAASSGGPLLFPGRLASAIGETDALGVLAATLGGGDALEQREKDRNNNTYLKIRGKDLIRKTDNQEVMNAEQQAYQDILSMSDSEFDTYCMKEITPESYTNSNGVPNLGVPTLAALYGTYTKDGKHKDAAYFSRDDLRHYMAKKAAYEAYLSPMDARDALDNLVKKDVSDRRGVGRKLEVFADDVGTSVMTYILDKVDGFAEVNRILQDNNIGPKELYQKPRVFVDSQGQIVDPEKHHIIHTNNGNHGYMDEQGQVHLLQEKEMSRVALHQMGLNFDGSEDTSVLNPQWRNRLEMYGVWDDDLQKKYEKLGVSPYRMINPMGEENGLLYEGFKMMSFGIADVASTLLPFGVGVMGRSLSAASKAGSVLSKTGKVIEGIGMGLAGEARAGQVLHGVAGALGIANAYERGMFQESYARNLSELEEKASVAARNDVAKQYAEDKGFRAQVDGVIAERAQELKADYISRMEEGMQIADEEALDKMLYSQAQKEVFDGLVSEKYNQRKNSKEYADKVVQAANEAGSGAMLVFGPEALKYGLVNTLGWRSYIYKNPMGVTTKVDSSLKGLQETNAAGKMRMRVEAPPLTTKQKWMNFGKTAGKVMWGGAWTNGSDDMMVDAAQEVNNDSYDRFLHDYITGESTAETYGVLDGILSYIDGFTHSLGQETTWNAAAVGAIGSAMSGSINFYNVAKLFTKEGRKEFKETYLQRAKLDENGMHMRDENGKYINEDITWNKNKGELLSYFVQNGVLNTYYGEQVGKRRLQNMADAVNEYLDNHDDFNAVSDLVLSNINEQDAANPEDASTGRFIKAIQSLRALEHLPEHAKNAMFMSSVVQNAFQFIRNAQHLDEGQGEFSNEDIDKMLSQYYKENPSVPQSEENNASALMTIAENARELQGAVDKYEEAEEYVKQREKALGRTILPSARERMKLQHAMLSHWQERLDQKKEVIHDTSSLKLGEPETDVHLSVLGGRKNAMELAKKYSQQEEELTKLIEEHSKDVDKAQKEYDEAVGKMERTTDSDALLEAQKEVIEKKNALDNQILQEEHLQNMLDITQHKARRLELAFEWYDRRVEEAESTEEVQEAKGQVEQAKEKVEDAKSKLPSHNPNNKKREKAIEKATEAVKNPKRELSKALRKAKKEYNAVPRVLTAEEIFNLDVVSRAFMMNEKNRGLYSKAQQREIVRLEKQLSEENPEAPNLIQDIAYLSQKIATVSDALYKIGKNPEAASVRFESEREQALMAAYNLNRRLYAKAIALHMHKTIREVENRPAMVIDSIKRLLKDEKNPEMLKIGRKELRKAMQEYVFLYAKNLAPRIISLLEEEGVLSAYSKQLEDAKKWSRMKEDIGSVIDGMDKTDEEKESLKNVVDSIIYGLHTPEEVIAEFEKVVDDTDGEQSSEDFEKILEGLVDIEYQRDAVVIENREERRKKQAEEKRLREEQRDKDAKAAQEAARKAEEEKKRKEEEKEKKLKSESEKVVTGEEDPEVVPMEDVIDTEGSVVLKKNVVRFGDSGVIEEGKPEGEGSVEDTAIHKDGDVVSETTVQEDGTKVTKFTRYRKTKSGEVKAVTNRTDGLEIDTSLIAPESAMELSLYDKAVLVELREKDGQFAGTMYATLEQDTGAVMGDHVEVRFTKNPISTEEAPEETTHERTITKPSYYSSTRDYFMSVDDKGKQTLDNGSIAAYITNSKNRVQKILESGEQASLLNGVAMSRMASFVRLAIDSGILPESLRLELNGDHEVMISQENQSKVGKAVSELKKLGIEKFSDLFDYIESHEKKPETAEQPEGKAEKAENEKPALPDTTSRTPVLSEAAKPFVERLNAATTNDEVTSIYAEGIKAGVDRKELSAYRQQAHERITKESKKASSQPTEGSQPARTVLNEQQALDALIKQYSGHAVSLRDLTLLLYGTKYVREVIDGSGRKGITLDSMAIEEALGNYLEDKYPHLYVAARAEGKGIPVVKDMEGNEYGCPSTVLDQYSKGAKRYKELLDGKQENLKLDEPTEEEEVEVVDSGEVRAVSPTLDAQLSQMEKESGTGATDNKRSAIVVSSNNNGGMATETSRIEKSTETNPEFLSANSMMPWTKEPLELSGVLEHKKGAEENDNMNKFYRWMDSMGISLQNIIDHELAGIFSENPHMPIRFMTVRPEDNATHDKDVESTLFLVIDYNDSVRAHHNEANGGVIDSMGNKYLIVGTVGYGKKGNKAREQLYWNLFNSDTKRGRKPGLVLQGADEFWKANKGERFRVVEGLYTEMVPGSLIPGYRVRRMEQAEGSTPQEGNAETSNHRDIRELFVDDPNINPYGFTSLKDLYFCIQEGRSLASTLPSGFSFMAPNDIERNLGNVFVFLPASNRVFFPAEIRVLKYKGIKDGKLKSKVDVLLRQLTSRSSYDERYDALLKLQKIFYFAPKGRGDTFLLSKNKPSVTIVSEGIKTATFNLDDSFDFAAFMEAFQEMDPRVNITMELLSSKSIELAKGDVLTMEDYADACAFQVDLAKFGTSGSSYSIYGIDAEGKMTGYGKTIVPGKAGSIVEGRKVRQIPYGSKDNYYSYDPATNTYSQPGETITSDSNPSLFMELEYNRRVLDNGLVPADSNGVWFTYILTSGAHPEVIEIHSSTYKVKKLSEEEALSRIEKIGKEKADAARGDNAEGALASRTVVDLRSMMEDTDVEVPVAEEQSGTDVEDDVSSVFGLDPENLGMEETDIAPVVSSAVQAQSPAQTVQDNGTAPESASASQVDLGNVPGESPSSMTFGELYANPEAFMVLDELISNAFPDAVDINDIETRLREKGVDTTSIGNTKEEVDAWIQQLKCRLA